jgi:hypothetical protein
MTLSLIFLPEFLHSISKLVERFGFEFPMAAELLA